MFKWLRRYMIHRMYIVDTSHSSYKELKPPFEIYTQHDAQLNPHIQKTWKSQIHFNKSKTFVVPTPNGTHIKDILFTEYKK